MAEKKPENKKETNDKLDKLIELLATKELKSLEKDEEEKKRQEEADKTLSEMVARKRKAMEKQLREDEYLPYRLDATDRKVTNVVTIISQDGKKVDYDSYGVPWSHTFNGYYYAVPRGVSLMLPETVVKRLQKASQGISLALDEIDKRLIKGKDGGID